MMFTCFLQERKQESAKIAIIAKKGCLFPRHPCFTQSWFRTIGYWLYLIYPLWLQQVSARIVARTLSLSWSTVHKMLRHIFRHYPYKIKMLQELKPHDDILRIDFANFILQKISKDETWIQRVLWIDETHFTLSGSVNAYNCRIWGTSNQYVERERAPPFRLCNSIVWNGL